MTDTVRTDLPETITDPRGDTWYRLTDSDLYCFRRSDCTGREEHIAYNLHGRSYHDVTTGAVDAESRNR